MTVEVAATPEEPHRVVHVITTLERGGAELQLLRILTRADRSAFTPTVVGLLGDGPLRGLFEERGIRVVRLNMRRGVPDPRALAKLVAVLREVRPDLVQTWLYHADLLGSLAAGLAGVRTVIWTLQCGVLEAGHLNLVGRFTVGALRRLARRVPTRIVCSSRETQRVHEDLGYPPERMVFVPNGADTQVFRPDPAARRAIRAELGLREQAVLVGMVARYDPQKDYHNLIEAAERVCRRRPEVRFLACGRGVEDGNAELKGWVDAAALGERFRLLGPRTDVAAVDAALDVGCLSSAYGEAFPLAISEQMACGLPCVVTEAGDMADMVGPTGRIVPPRDPEALASAIEELVALPAAERRSLGAAARRRVARRFSLDATVAGYEGVWRDSLAEAASRWPSAGASSSTLGRPRRTIGGLTEGAADGTLARR